MGVGVAWALRDGAGVSVASAVPGMVAASAVLASVGLGWVVFAGVVLLLSTEVFAAGAFVLASSSASPVSLVVASACTCCSEVSWGRIVSAMTAMGIVELTMDVHTIAQSK